MRLIRPTLMVLALLAATGPASAHSYKADEVRIGHPWAQPAQGPDGEAYVAILNTGKTADRLLSATTPAAKRVVILEEVPGGRVPVVAMPVEPMRAIPMRPGARALKLEGLAKPLALGDRFPMTLVFERSGKVEVEIFVEQAPGH